MKFRIKLEPKRSIKLKINTVMLARILNRVSKDQVRQLFIQEFEKQIKQSPAWISLDSNAAGSLTADFGLRRGEITPSLNTILGVWLDSIAVKFKTSLNSSKFKLRILVTGVPADFADVISLGAAITKAEDDDMPWLKWLLLEGDRTIIQGFHVQTGNFLNSRSGKAIMEEGASFSVNPSFSGTSGNNFVTDAINKMNQELSVKIGRLIKDAVR